SLAAWQAWAEHYRAEVAAAGHPMGEGSEAAAGRALFARFRAAEERLAGQGAGRAAAATAGATRRAGLVLPLLLLAGGGLTLVLCLLAALFVARRRDEVDLLARSVQAQHESEALGRTLVDHAPVGIARMDLGGRFLSGNPALCDMLGCTEGELRQLRDADVTDPDDLAKSRRVLEELARRGAPQAVLEKRYVRKDGSSFWAELTVAPVLDRGGLVQSLVALVEDVSHRKEP